MAKMHARGGKVADDELEGELLARAVATAGDFDPQGVANLLWALATMGSKPDARLLEAMQGRATATADDFKPQEVANLLWALATMGSKPGARLLEAIQARATATVGKFIPVDVVHLMWALATMGSKPDARLLEAVQARAVAAAGDFNPQDVANLMWALACFDISHSQLSGLMVESMADRLLSVHDQLIVEGKFQMHQWLLFCDLHPEWRGKLPRSMQQVKEELGGVFRQAFALQLSTTSRLQVIESLFSVRLLASLTMRLQGAEPVLV
jgi:hypothetical protein